MHIPLIYIIIYLCFCAWLLKIKIKIKNLFLGKGEGGKYHIFLMNGHWPMQYSRICYGHACDWIKYQWTYDSLIVLLFPFEMEMLAFIMEFMESKVFSCKLKINK